MTPKSSRKSNVIIEGKIKKWKLFNYMSKPPKKVVESYSDPQNSPLEPLKSNFKCQNSGNHRKWKLFKYMRWQKGIEPHIEPKNSPLGQKKSEKRPQIKSKLNARIKENKENENYCTILVNPKTIWTWPQPSK